MAKTDTAAKTKLKKKWFPILSPKFLGQKEVGESYLTDSKDALGRVMKANLKDITGSMGDQNIYVSLKINGVSGNTLQTEALGYAYMPFFIKKLARRNTSKVEDSFLVKTKDGQKVRLKPLVLLVFAANKSVKTAIRKKLREELAEAAGKADFEILLNDLMKRKLQMDFRKILNRISPVKEVVLRVVKTAGEKEKAEIKEEN